MYTLSFVSSHSFAFSVHMHFQFDLIYVHVGRKGQILRGDSSERIRPHQTSYGEIHQVHGGQFLRVKGGCAAVSWMGVELILGRRSNKMKPLQFCTGIAGPAIQNKSLQLVLLLIRNDETFNG